MINEDFSRRSKLKDLGRWYVTNFVEGVAKNLPSGASILDAGAGECVYKRFFSHCNYKAIDLAVGENKWNYANLDYVGPLHDMPIGDETFDAILCTQVLEHLEWPRESVKEMYRVLKPGGKIFLTVPMAHNEHQVPYDFFRYTSYGISSICKHAGFKDIKTVPFGGRWVRWAFELPRGITVFPLPRLRGKDSSIRNLLVFPFRVMARILLPLLQLLFLWFDTFDLEKDDTFGWSCEATK